MQIQYSFDKETLIKIAKGSLIAITGGASIALLNYLGTIQISNVVLAGATATIIPILVNTVREWIKGNEPVNEI
jgi:hypothetical protein